MRISVEDGDIALVVAAARREVRHIEVSEVQRRLYLAIDRLETAVSRDAMRRQASGIGGRLGTWAD